MRPLAVIFKTPGAIAFMQVLALSLTFSYGIDFLQKNGLRKRDAYILTGIITIAPTNVYMPITIWKDIPYATSLLLLFILFCDISVSQGNCLKSAGKMIWVIIAGICVALFRPNGIFVALIALFFLPFWVKEQKKRAWIIFSSIILGITFIKGIVYPATHIIHIKSYAPGTNLVYFLSAHIHENTERTVEQTEYINSLLPIEQWKYNPCMQDEIVYSSNLNFTKANETLPTLAHTLLELTRKSPITILRHMKNTSRNIWQIGRGGCYEIHLPFYGFYEQGDIHWVYPDKEGLHENSKLPLLIKPLFQIFYRTRSNAVTRAVFWRPALLTYLSFFACIAFALKRGKFRYILPITIPILQFSVLLIGSVAQDMRYQNMDVC